MNDEPLPSPPSANSAPRSLEQRLAGRPQVLARFHAITDMLDHALAAGCTADEAEARTIVQVQQLGRELLGDWAQEQQAQSLAQAQAQQPQAIKHVKKK
ncbi:MAG TPA: hypothetical protein VHO25_20495 [Polyangiaceae bacterium]|nr:hypothetical protein [Polyangiaceae bacterium]